eukprot:5369794-Pleurochrysis_carterae.AAC.1
MPNACFFVSSVGSAVRLRARRRALAASPADAEWCLDWCDERISCTVSGDGADVPPLISAARGDRFRMRVRRRPLRAPTPAAADHSFAHVPQSHARDSDEDWLFLTVRYTPGAAAWAAYGAHTRRDPKPLIAEGATEEIALFFRATAEGLPAPQAAALQRQQQSDHAGRREAQRARESDACGVLHALLPTRLQLPFRAHVHGPWLLSVDRQDVQSLGDSDWNADVAKQLPMLFVLALRHIAQVAVTAGRGGEARFSAGGLSGSYSLLPQQMERAGGTRTADGVAIAPLSLRIFGLCLDMSALDRAL